MPATYWLPLPDLDAPARVEHLHAAFSRWFDRSDTAITATGSGHHDNVKPYRLAPMSQHHGQWGAQVSILTQDAFHRLEQRITQRSVVVLGNAKTLVGMPVVIGGEAWADLARWPGERGWRVDFLTPFTTRTQSRSSPFPSPPVVLRAATDVWEKFSGHEAIRVPRESHRHLWVSDVDISTTTYTINGHRHPGALGSITYRADNTEVARDASTLFRLAHYCGMGSFRGKGMGVVAVTPLLGQR